MDTPNLIILAYIFSALFGLLILIWFIRSLHRIIDLLKSIENLQTHILHHTSKR